MATPDDAPRDDTRTAAQVEADQKDLESAKADWTLSENATRDQRDREKTDLDFEAGQHWTEAELAWKKDKVEPAFVIDQLSGPINQVVNQPVHRINVTAVGKGADPTSAQYWQGLARRVENLSGADAVYKWARKHAVKMGRGFWRVRADYFSPVEKAPDGRYDLTALEQDIRIEAIIHQQSVYEDPRCRELDFSDARFAILIEEVEWSEMKRRWPEGRYTGQSVFPADSTRDWPGRWTTTKTVQVAERYYIEDDPLTLCLLIDGTVVEKHPKTPYPPEQVKVEHTFQLPRVKWMRFTAAEVLERADVPGRYIPVVKIVGDRRILTDGTDDCRGMVRMGRDPQRYVNFMESRLAKAVDEDSWSTVMAEADSVAEFEHEWQNIHIERPSLVRYKGTRAVDGQRLDKPEVIRSSPDVGAIALAATRASMGLRSVLGQPDVTPEELRPEQSGRAIKAREAQLHQSTSHFGDATASGIALTGRIIVSMGREVWTMPRIMRIVGMDEKPVELVTFSGAAQQPQAQQMGAQPPGLSPEQQRHLLDLTLGEFDVTVSAGKGYQSGREETVDVLSNAVPNMPPAMQAKAWPILLKNMDAPGMQELATAIEPEQQPGPTAEQAQQAQMMIDALSEQVLALKDDKDQKDADRQSKERIEQAKIESARLLEDQRFAHELTLAKLHHDLEMEKVRLQHDREMEALRHAHAHARAIGAESDIRASAHEVDT